MATTLVLFVAFLGLGAAQFPCYDQEVGWMFNWRVKNAAREYTRPVIWKNGDYESPAQQAFEMCKTDDLCDGFRCYEHIGACDLASADGNTVVNKGEAGYEAYREKVASYKGDDRFTSYFKRNGCDPVSEELSLAVEDDALTITPRFTSKTCHAGEKCHVSYTITDSAGEVVTEVQASICKVKGAGVENCQNAKHDHKKGFLFRRIGVWKGYHLTEGDWVLTLEHNGETITSDPISVTVE